ncbi:MAG: phosphopantothenoylcysteine decarboxylase [Candidatus Omnitrophica bacterium]|nr:phosphopantothenoylcysteine decarboxylase [Candidatus Omnitrophota bacterium]
MQSATLKGRRVLITAGPTWVAIDKVRVISNISTGNTGILLAKQADKMGARVTLILGPIGETKLGKTINVKRYNYFDELYKIIRQELKTRKYDAVIHSAAVSDYKLKKENSRKIKSDIKNLNLVLKPTAKIINNIKKYAAKTVLVLFKLELGVSQDKMIERARKAMQSSRADLAVANTFSGRKTYQALIIDRDKVFCKINSKKELARKLLEIISFQSN